MFHSFQLCIGFVSFLTWVTKSGNFSNFFVVIFKPSLLKIRGCYFPYCKWDLSKIEICIF
jgi:hypothetical protein